MTAPTLDCADPATLAARVEDLLRARVPAARDVTVSDPVRVFGGNARIAWACDATWTVETSPADAPGGKHEEPLILLIRAAGSQVQTDPAREFAALDGLAERGVRAPRVWAHDPDGRVFGAPAVLLERLPGGADAVEYLSANPALGRARTLDLARAAAELHIATPAPRPDESQLTYWRERYEDSRLEPYPALTWLFDWLEDNTSEPEHFALVHGDFRPGNVLYAGERIVGLLDWEMAHVGDPVEDIAWAYHALWSPERFVPIEDFVAAYEAAGGPPVTEARLRWNRIFCEVKYATISLQAARSFLDGRSRNLRLIDRARTVIPSIQACLGWIAAAGHQEVRPC
ncbi:phosphotransferase family protein [Amycolatopsis sp.]|uniref:phosphotransferase family protein n=1 Tax=Amycolatopsis sp. TaxID=37632 RepID=UPI002CD5D88B|nr:phosphotransferase family protein [Amycolatopsis sp.]HVV09311.1 phosphotransferase family protein [Amycolatopsis sp.]